jgi:hypothetical protein
MSQLSAIFIHADRLRQAAEHLETVMKRMDERPAGESLARDLDDAMAEVVSASAHTKRLSVLINEARAADRGFNGPSGTACNVFAFAKSGGPRPKPRAVPAPTGDEFDEPTQRRKAMDAHDPI